VRQLEDPAEASAAAERGARDVIRLVTRTLTEDTPLDARRNNYLRHRSRALVRRRGKPLRIAWIDISTGEFRITSVTVPRSPPASPG
jgi:DNA mismatch repair ATPase MutS